MRATPSVGCPRMCVVHLATSGDHVDIVEVEDIDPQIESWKTDLLVVDGELLMS